MILTAGSLFVLMTCFSSFSCAETESKKRIFQITEDQLRGDLPQRFLNSMGKGGFRYLYDEGVVSVSLSNRDDDSTQPYFFNDI